VEIRDIKLHVVCICLLVLFTLPGWGATRFVNPGNSTPISPYTDWSTSATNIQDAIDAALPGDEILVTNGVYQAGGRVMNDGNVPTFYTTNRVVVTKAVTVQSVNGAAFTFIVGSPALGTADAVRCVYLTNGAALIGFTLTNGATQVFGSGGGICCLTTNAMVANCTIAGNAAYQGAGAYGATLTNCLIVGNSGNVSGGAGGGVWGSALANCTLLGNSANYGGGAYYSTLDHCTIYSNSAINLGGGESYSILNDCSITANSAPTGGGGNFGVLCNCLIASNAATYGGQGGGTYGAVLTNCTLLANSADLGGGTCYGHLYNCALIYNRGTEGGGAYEAHLYRCIIGTNSAVLGGGAYNGVMNACVIIGNTASSDGGGVYSSGPTAALNDCLVIKNSAQNGGGCGSLSPNGTLGLTNCTIVKNSASNSGGGVNGNYSGGESVMDNCIVIYNSAASGSNYTSIQMNHCCTAPVPSTNVTSFDNAPLFVDITTGDYHLQPNSPCVNAGLNSYVVTADDLDGNPRVAGGTVDIGAYERSPASSISYGWLFKYGLPTDGSVDFSDPDGDGIDNLHEWLNGTDPTNILISLFSLQNDGQDTLGVSPPMDMMNITFTNGALALPRDVEYRARANIHGLSYTSFTASVDFKPTSFASPNRCILSGGLSTRWLELDNDAEGRLELKLNNWDVAYPLKKRASLRRWHRLACSVNIDAKKIVVVLDGQEITNINLMDFQFNVIGSPYEDSDKSFSFVSGGTGGSLCGFAKNLLIYGRALFPSELAVASGKPVFVRILNSRGGRRNPVFATDADVVAQRNVYWLTDQQNRPIQIFHYPAGSSRRGSSSGSGFFNLNTPFYLDQFTTSLVVHVILSDGVERQYPLEQATIKAGKGFEVISF
jgi:hypothetical protein